jgi:hypothetical protein
MFENPSQTRSGGAVKILLPLVIGAFLAAVLLFLYDMHGSIVRLETAQAANAAALKQMDDRLDTEDSTMRAATSALAEKVGMTDQRLRDRTAQLRREQKNYEVRLRQEQNQQFEGVRTEQKAQKEQIEGVRNDMTATRGDLEVTKAKLERTIGDLGVQSGLIAHTREDLDQLRRRGDRNYYEFTLAKGKRPTRVSTVSLQLKKTNPRRGKFTLNVTADDWTIEKRDRTLFEPMQFYSGRDRQLYEVVVMSVDKNKVSGYLSTPKQYGSPQAQGQ